MQLNHPEVLQQLTAQRAEELRAAGPRTRRTSGVSRGPVRRRLARRLSPPRAATAWRPPAA